MKTKRLLTLLLVVATAFCAAFAVGCKNKDEKPATVESVTLSEESIELNTGDTLNYDAYTVTAGYSDGTSTTVPLTAAMFTAEDLAKFNTPGTYTVTVNAFGMQAMLTVTVKNRNFADVTAEDVTATYDGTAKLPVVANLPQGASVVWTYHVGTSAEGEVVTEPVNAGTYYAEGVVSLRYYDDKTLTANITISPKTINPAELTWANVKRVYTGQEIAVNVYPENLPDGVTVDGYEGDVKGTALGTYTVTVKFGNENPNYTIVETYNVEWSIINPLEATWYAAVNGELHVASFANTSATTGALDFDGAKTTYTVAYNETTGGATFSELNGSATEITLNGSILRITVGNTTYVLVNKEDLASYYSGNEYDMLTAQFKIDLDESAKTLRLVITTAAGTQEKPLTITAEESATLVREVKLVVDEDMWLEYYWNYNKGNVRIYGFTNPNGYKSDSYYDLATETAAKELLAGLTNGTFADVNGNELRINGAKDVKYNGRMIELYVALSNGTPTVYAAVNSDNANAKLEICNGYYKFNNSLYAIFVYYDKAGIGFAGTYYLENDGTVSDTEKVEFMSSSSDFDIRTKLLNAENTAESKTFTVNAAETSDRAVLNLADGELTATLYLKNSTEVYATLVFKDNGATVVYGSKNFLKVDKLIEKVGYDGAEYYSADGTKLKYDGKGKFTLGDTDYTKYSLVFADGTLTVTIGEGDDTHVIVYTEKRYVTVDDEIYLSDNTDSFSDGYVSVATFINGNDTISVSKNVVKVNDVALTDVVFSFVDDGNNNGRTVLKISGKLGDEDYSVMFYSLIAVKTNEKTFVLDAFKSYFNETFSPVEHADKSFSITESGKVMINGSEMFPQDLSSGGFAFYIEKGTTVFKGAFYINHGYATIKDDEGLYNYNSEFFKKFKGVYVSEDRLSVFAFLKESEIYANETLYTSPAYTMKSDIDGEIVVTVGGKDAAFSVVNGKYNLTYDGKDFNFEKDFDLSAYYGTYDVLFGLKYSTITFNDKTLTSGSNTNKASIQKFVMSDGNISIAVRYSLGTWTYKDAYIVKNTDASTAAALPFYAVAPKIIYQVGTGRFNGKVFEIAVKIVDDDNKKLPALTCIYDGKAARLTDYAEYGNKMTTVIDGVSYTIEPVSTTGTPLGQLLVYETFYSSFFGEVEFNGNKFRLGVAVNQDGESVYNAAFNNEQVNIVFGNDIVDNKDNVIGKVFSFTLGGINYKGNMSSNYNGPQIRVLNENEYEFFYSQDYDKNDDIYSLTINGKEFRFCHSVDRVSQNYSAYEIVFKLADQNSHTTLTSYDGKPATFAYYVRELKTVVFGTADGNFAYNLETKVLTESVTFDGLRELVYDNNTAVSGMYVTGRITEFNGTVAKVDLFYDFGSSGMNKLTVTAIDEGYKLVGKNTSGNDVTTYLLTEGQSYVLYPQAQYEIIGTYTVGDKQLVIEGTHKDGVFSYTATYGDETNVKVKPDFTKKSFTFIGKTVATVFSWTVDNGEMVITGIEIPASATVFLKTGSDNMINLDRNYDNYSVTITVKDVVDNKVKYNIAYTSGYGNRVAEGVLSDDGTYISAAIREGTGSTDVKVRIYLNAVTNDEYYKLVAVYESSDSAKYVGEFGLGGTDKLTVTLAATSEEDDDYDVSLAGANFRITYTVGGNSVTATVKYARTLADGLEFKANGKTYVAKLVDGAMTVTEKTAA